MQNIFAEHIQIGQNCIIHPTAVIRGLHGNAASISLGDNVYIGQNVQIICDNFSIGDYSKIHHDTNVHGYKPCHIGHNAWIGQFCIIDCIGGVEIGNNCGIGAGSQLWSHIKYGDTLEGSRFLSEGSLIIGNDVWFVGHCIVSPITAADKSMALAGSVITKNMDFNTVYAGVPAVAISNRIGTSFVSRSDNEKFMILKDHLANFAADCNDIKIVLRDNDVNFSDHANTYFSIESRRYTKRRLTNEVSFMQYLLPEKAKFIPF